MKKNKKTLPLVLTALFGIATLSGCSSQGSTATWYNPLTWDWSWANPVTWFQKDTDISDDEEPVEDENNPAPQAKQMTFDIQAAFGQTGKKVITVNVSPSNADVDLTFTANKAEIVVTKTAAKTADVYVTTYFAGYGEITVTDTVSGIQATGKVYSYGKTKFESQMNLAHGKTGPLVISNTENKATTAGVVAIAPSISWLEGTLASIHDDWGAPETTYVHPSNTVYLHIGYEGSFAPVVWNRTNNQLYQVAGDTAKDPGIGVKTIAVTLVSGSNELYVIGRPTPTVPSKPIQEPENIPNLLAGFIVKNATAAQGMSFDDITFYE